MFNITDSEILDSTNIFTENLTQEEKQEMYAIGSTMEHANSCELMGFISQENALSGESHPHHKVVTEKELDRLADNNSVEQTIYQTRWAFAVLKCKESY